MHITLGSQLLGIGEELKVSRPRPQSVAQLRAENDRLKAEVEFLRAQALTDPLTNLPNRRYLDARLDHEISRAIRHEQPLAVLCIDVDDFKRVNDTWGHQKGDEVLIWVARFLKTQIRAHDIAGRMGGDEFLVILPATDRVGAEQLAARFRKTLEQLKGGADHPVSLSIGVGILDPDDSDVTVEALMRAGDRAMYEQKARPRRLRRQ